jgi:hypothetical protein
MNRKKQPRIDDPYTLAMLGTHDTERFDLLCLTPLSAIFQLYHGDQF